MATSDPIALASLPIPRWLHRFRDGTLRVGGTLKDELRLSLGVCELSLSPGALRLGMVFEGGPAGLVTRVQISSEQLCWNDAGSTKVGSEWSWFDGVAVLDGAPVGGLGGRKGYMIRQLIDSLHDVSVETRLVPKAQLKVKAGMGIHVRIPAGQVLTAVGGAEGAPDHLRLSRPVVIGFGGRGIELEHERHPRLSRFVGLRVQRATLHPDGRVVLEGRGGRGMGLAVRRGLGATSEVLSSLVKESKQFSFLRSFLAHST